MKNKNLLLKNILAVIIALCLIVGAFFIGKSVSCQSNDNIAPLNYQDIFQGIDYGDVTYVIGHKIPDTDTVISAITYANLKNQLGINCKPMISGKLNNETKFILEYFGVAVPEILENAEDKNMILVDHSTYTQTVDGMEKANIVEIIDHHGLGDVKTALPLYIKDMAIGATATIVYTSYVENNIQFDKVTAGLLTAAILSDTSGLSSATTTSVDKEACKYLASIAGIDDIDAFYSTMVEYANSYDGMTNEEIFYSDYKEYEMNGRKIGIACVNAAGEKTEPMCKAMSEFMQSNYDKQSMEHLYVMIYDNKNDSTVLLFYGDGAEQIVKSAFGEPKDNKIVFTPGVSRKKVVVPKLEEAYSGE